MQHGQLHRQFGGASHDVERPQEFLEYPVRLEEDDRRHGEAKSPWW